jgi:hypothetical protein
MQAFPSVLKSGNLRKLALPDRFHVALLENFLLISDFSLLTHLECPWLGNMTMTRIMRSLPKKLVELNLVVSNHNYTNFPGWTTQNIRDDVFAAVADTVVVSGCQHFVVPFVFNILDFPDPPRVRLACNFGMVEMVEGRAGTTARMDLLTLVVPRQTVWGSLYVRRADAKQVRFGVEYEVIPRAVRFHHP